MSSEIEEALQKAHVKLRFGRGTVAQLDTLVAEKTLVVTGIKTLERLPVRLNAEFFHVPANPPPQAVDDGATVARRIDAQTVLGIGGGSALDVAKSVAVTMGHAEGVQHFRSAPELQGVSVARPRLIQVPTTSGTGSEMTPWASLWQAGEKWSLDHPSAFADLALVDPALSDTMPRRLTCATGLDAMAHAMESLWSVHHGPVSDVLAKEALRLVGEHLLPAVQEPTPESRDGMSRAACLAGAALAFTRSAGAHALSYYMTGRCGLEHGLAVGLTCKALLPITAKFSPLRVGHVLEALGHSDIDGALGWIDDVFAAAGLQADLVSLGVPLSAVDDIVKTASGSNRMKNHPGTFDASTLRQVLGSVAKPAG